MNVPNIITLIRLFLIPVFVVAFHYDRLDIAAIIFITAWISDVLDGYIARRYNLVTDFGKLFDPLADKLMSLTALFCLGFKEIIPWIIPMLVLGKELAMMIGGAFLYKKRNLVKSAKWVGKIATFLFTVAIVLTLFGLDKLGEIALWIAVASAFVALISYLIDFLRVVRKENGKTDAGQS